MAGKSRNFELCEKSHEIGITTIISRVSKMRLMVCICGCFGNVCTCVYWVLYCLYCVFCIVSFMYIYSYLFCLY